MSDPVRNSYAHRLWRIIMWAGACGTVVALVLDLISAWWTVGCCTKSGYFAGLAPGWIGLGYESTPFLAGQSWADAADHPFRWWPDGQ
jgi:hypothetical protein